MISDRIIIVLRFINLVIVVLFSSENHLVMFSLSRFITIVIVLLGCLGALAYNVGTGNFFFVVIYRVVSLFFSQKKIIPRYL